MMAKKRTKDCPFCQRMRGLLIFTALMAVGLIFLIQQSAVISQQIASKVLDFKFLSRKIARLSSLLVTG